MPAIPYIIEAVLAGLGWLFRTQLGRWIVSLLLFFGISLTSQHYAVTPLLDQLRTYASNVGGAGSFGSTCLQWLGVLNFDKALTMVFSAIATKYSITAGKVFLQRKSG